MKTSTSSTTEPSLELVASTYAAVKAIAGIRPVSFGVWVREFHPGRVRVEWSAHIQGLGRRDAQTAAFLIEQLQELDVEDARARRGVEFGIYVPELAEEEAAS